MKTKENSNLRKLVDREKVTEMYNSGCYVKEIATSLGMSQATTARLLRELGLKRIRRTFEEQQAFYKEYILQNKDIKTVTQICRELHINYGTYKKALNGEYESKNFKNDIDESFVTIENPYFCYILGLFLADGHIDATSIYISQCDASFLKKLQKIIGHHGKLNRATNTENPCYTLHIRSYNFRLLLDEANVESNKKLSAPYIDCGVNQKHFIRGLFDGDGNLYYSYISGKLQQRRFSIATGSISMALGIKSFLESLNIQCTVSEEVAVNTNYSVFVDKIDDIIKVMHILYDEAENCFLDRKYYSFIKFEKLINMNREVNEIVDSVLKNAE